MSRRPAAGPERLGFDLFRQPQLPLIGSQHYVGIQLGSTADLRRQPGSASKPNQHLILLLSTASSAPFPPVDGFAAPGWLVCNLSQSYSIHSRAPPTSSPLEIKARLAAAHPHPAQPAPTGVWLPANPLARCGRHVPPRSRMPIAPSAGSRLHVPLPPSVVHQHPAPSLPGVCLPGAESNANYSHLSPPDWLPGGYPPCPLPAVPAAQRSAGQHSDHRHPILHKLRLHSAPAPLPLPQSLHRYCVSVAQIQNLPTTASRRTPTMANCPVLHQHPPGCGQPSHLQRQLPAPWLASPRRYAIPLRSSGPTSMSLAASHPQRAGRLTPAP